MNIVHMLCAFDIEALLHEGVDPCAMVVTGSMTEPKHFKFRLKPRGRWILDLNRKECENTEELGESNGCWDRRRAVAAIHVINIDLRCAAPLFIRAFFSYPQKDLTRRSKSVLKCPNLRTYPGSFTILFRRSLVSCCLNVAPIMRRPLDRISHSAIRRGCHDMRSATRCRLANTTHGVTSTVLDESIAQ
jgi:hypothetical protein